MVPDNAGLLQTELARLEKQLHTVQYGQVSLTLIVHAGQVSRVIRGVDVSVKPSGSAS